MPYSPHRKTASQPYMPSTFSPSDVRPVEGKHRPAGGYQTTGITRWGQPGDKFAARQFEQDKADTMAHRTRMGVLQGAKSAKRKGTYEQDWKQRTVINPGEHYAVYGSGTYGYHGMKHANTLHGGSHGFDYSKASNLQQKHRDEAFKAQTVQAGMDRDYHEMVMRRGHIPGDRSQAQLKSARHPDTSDAQAEWELKRRLRNQNKLHVTNQATKDNSNSEEVKQRKEKIVEAIVQDKEQFSAEETAFKEEVKAKLSAPREAPVEEPAEEPAEPPTPSAPCPSGVVEDAPYPTGEISNDQPEEEQDSPAVEAPGLHSRYAEDEEEYYEEFFPDPYGLPAPFGPYPPHPGFNPYYQGHQMVYPGQASVPSAHAYYSGHAQPNRHSYPVGPPRHGVTMGYYTY